MDAKSHNFNKDCVSNERDANGTNHLLQEVIRVLLEYVDVSDEAQPVQKRMFSRSSCTNTLSFIEKKVINYKQMYKQFDAPPPVYCHSVRQ